MSLQKAKYGGKRSLTWCPTSKHGRFWSSILQITQNVQHPAKKTSFPICIPFYCFGMFKHGVCHKRQLFSTLFLEVSLGRRERALRPYSSLTEEPFKNATLCLIFNALNCEGVKNLFEALIKKYIYKEVHIQCDILDFFQMAEGQDLISKLLQRGLGGRDFFRSARL